jgi:PTB domain-containing engulfment adapter protein 1
LQPRTTAINGIKDIFGAEPFGKNLTADPFGMDDFGRLASPPADSEFHTTTLGLLDRRITEMREGFSRGISFGGDDFNLESLDPLRS